MNRASGTQQKTAANILLTKDKENNAETNVDLRIKFILKMICWTAFCADCIRFLVVYSMIRHGLDFLWQK